MKNNKFIWITIIAILVLIVGGWYSYTSYRDSWIPSRFRMAQAIADIYLIDAVAQNGTIDQQRNDKTMENAYHTILNKYGITKVQYDSIICIYAQDPDNYTKLYDDVVTILSKKEADYEQLYFKYDSVQKRISTLQDSLKVIFWKSPTYIHIPLTKLDTLDKNLKFKFKHENMKGGKLTYSFDYTFPRSNKSTDYASTSVIIVYDDKNADTCRVELSKKNFSLQHMLIEHQLRDTIPASEIIVRLIETKNIADNTCNFSSIKMFYVPYNITDSVQFDEIQLPKIFAY